MHGFLEFMQHNLAHVLPILVCAAFGLLITLERFRSLVLVYPLHGTVTFFERLRGMVMADQLGEAIALCERYRDKPSAYVAREGLLRAHQPEDLIEHGLQIAIGEQTEKIQRWTSFLGTIANVATLCGLFGTIVGLVASFEAVGNANAQEKSALLANGISTAMNATMLGLAVAIPCMVVFSILMSKTNKLIAEVDRAGVRTLDLLKQRYYAEPDGDIRGGQGQGGSNLGAQAGAHPDRRYR